MPTYEYRCIDCQHEYEKREGFDAPALQKCPTCGGSARRVIRAPSVVFKGSGFYITDSRKPSAEAESEAKSEAAAKSDSSAPADKPPKDDKASTVEKPSSKKDEKPAKDAEPAAAS